MQLWGSFRSPLILQKPCKGWMLNLKSEHFCGMGRAHSAFILALLTKTAQKPGSKALSLGKVGPRDGDNLSLTSLLKAKKP